MHSLLRGKEPTAGPRAGGAVFFKPATVGEGNVLRLIVTVK